MKIALCILTLNEIDCLKALLPTIPKTSPDNKAYDFIYAIDGGSTDGTIEYFKENGIDVIGQSKRGRGDAFHQAFKNIQADAYIFFSPDGNEDVQDLGKFRTFLEKGADIVIASRMMKGAFNEEDSQVIKLRKWVNLVFNFFANVCFRKKGEYVTDSINGYRAITKKAAEELNLDALDYTIEYQMTIRAMKMNLNICEFPTNEGQRISGETQAKSLPTGIRFIKCYFRELSKRTPKVNKGVIR